MIEYRIANPADMNGVLALQSRYLAANLSEEEKKNGFVTTPFTETQLLGIIALNGLYVARDDHGIFAYLFAGNWQYFSQWEIFRYMISRFPDLRFRDKPITVEQSFQYGPVCIDIPYRSKGHLQQLFEKMRCDLLKKYPVSITFINQANDLSVAAHTKKLGWTIIEEFEFNNNQYFTLAFDMHQSVL